MATRKRWYVGQNGPIRRVFTSTITPTQAAYPDYKAVTGPFRTKRGAMFHAAFGAHNPHVHHVNDAERIAKRIGGAQ